MLILRDYQEQALEQLAEKFKNGARRILLVSPTGSGKTVMASHIILRSIAKGHQVLFVAHRKELVDQCSRKLTELSIPHGLIMAGRMEDDLAPVQVASLQTAIRRDLPKDIGLIITDECHHAAASSYEKIYRQYPEALFIGLTATPYRADGAGLGDVFEDWVRVAGIDELTDMGFLVPCRYWSPDIPDLSGVRQKGADWETNELAEAMSKKEIVGDIVKSYKSIAGGEKAICFAVNKEHGQKITDSFNKAGVPSAFLHDSVGKSERERILAWHRLGKYLVLVNVGILSEGYDDPTVSVCIQARPTLSVGLHIQQIGRVLRPHPDKAYAKVIDHAGNCRRLGLMEDHAVDLSSGLKKKLKRNEDEIAPALKTCKACYAVFASHLEACPLCGMEAKGPVRTIRTRTGELKELKNPVCECGSFDIEKRPSPKGTEVVCARCGKVLRVILPQLTPAEYYKRELQKCRESGWKEARAAILFKNRYGRWPDSNIRKQAA